MIVNNINKGYIAGGVRRDSGRFLTDSWRILDGFLTDSWWVFWWFLDGRWTVPPDIVDAESSGDVMVTEGSNSSLRCTATGHPTPLITWRREDGRPIYNNGQFNISFAPLPLWLRPDSGYPFQRSLIYRYSFWRATKGEMGLCQRMELVPFHSLGSLFPFFHASHLLRWSSPTGVNLSLKVGLESSWPKSGMWSVVIATILIG